MKANKIPASPKVINCAISIIKAHVQSPLNKATKAPKNKVVQEKPTGASFITPCLLLSLIVAKAIGNYHLFVKVAIAP